MSWNILRKTCNYHVMIRTFHNKSQFRVRFAPSPTGYLHLGGLRTALYNYLFARSNNGSFILRIEDTDQSRVVPGAVEQLHNDLFWAGIIPDEDPIRGGPFGPYIQSKRIDIYQEQVQTLLKNGSAYKCFCSQHRLELLKRAAVKDKQVPKYDNRCRNFTEDEVKERLKRGEDYCIRFKLVPTPEPFKDLIYGDITYDVMKNEGDPVIIKTDGYPTYHFANVVDDHFMQISHVLRGVEWQMSTPKHILLYKAFGWTPPQFAHLPLIINSDGTKLSKRQGDIKVENYRKDGIFPLALVNYITSSGGGFLRDKGLSHCYAYKDLVQQFNISSVNVNSSKLNPERLLEYNKLEISNLLKSDQNHRFLVEKIIKLVKETFPDRVSDGSLQLDHNHIITTLKWAQNRISKLSDMVNQNLRFLWVMPSSTESTSDLKYLDVVEILSKELENIDNNNFSKESLRTQLRDFANNNNIPFPDLMKTLRRLLSGLKDGPGVAEMMEILGRDATLDRLKRKATQ